MRTIFIVVSPTRLTTRTVEGLDLDAIRKRLDYLYEIEGWTQIRLPNPAGEPVADGGFKLFTPADRGIAAQAIVDRCR